MHQEVIDFLQRIVCKSSIIHRISKLFYNPSSRLKLTFDCALASALASDKFFNQPVHPKAKPVMYITNVILQIQNFLSNVSIGHNVGELPLGACTIPKVVSM